MELTDKQQQELSKVIALMKQTPVDYQAFDKNDVLWVRQVLAEDGVEMTPEEVSELIDFMAFVQTEVKKYS